MKYKALFGIVIIIMLMFTISGALAEVKDCSKVLEADKAKCELYDNNLGKLERDNIFGTITFQEDLYTKKDKIATLSKMAILPNTISIDSNINPEFKDIKAKLKFKNVWVSNPILLHNGEWVKDATLISCGLGCLETDVEGFSTYTISDNQWNGSHYLTTYNNGGLEKDSDYQLWMTFKQQDDLVEVKDDSAKNKTGYLTDTPVWERESPRSSKMNFNGIDQYGISNININHSLTDLLTLSFWIKPNLTNKVMFVAELSETYNTNDAYGIYINASGSMVFTVHTNAEGYQSIQDQTSVTDNEWTHVVATWNNTISGGLELELFVNGVSVGIPIFTQDLTTPISDSKRLYLASRAGSSSFYNGSIDNFNIYNKILTTSEITAQYETRSYNQKTPILTYDPEPTDLIIEDKTGNGYNQTSTGSLDRGSISEYSASYRFNGTNQIDMDAGMIPNATERTFFTWIKPYNALGTTQYFGMAYTAVHGSNSLYINTGNTYVTSIISEQGSTGLSMGQAQNDTWAFVGYTAEYIGGGLMQYCTYYNGNLRNCNNYAGTHLPAVTSAVNTAWGNHISGAGLNGSLSELTIFTRKLSEGEMSSLYNNSNPNLLYQPEGIYTSSIENITEYDPTIEQNVWSNISFTGICKSILQIDYRVNTCATIESTGYTTATWNEATCTANLLTNNNGKCMQFTISADSTGSDSFTLINYSYTNFMYKVPTLSNVNIFGGNTTLDDVFGNVTFLLNDTDAGQVDIDWYKNGIYLSTEIVTPTTNGTIAVSTLDNSNFIKDDVIYYLATPYNGIVAGNTYQSSNITIGNSLFTLNSYFPTTLNLTVLKPNTIPISIEVADVDGDVYWIVDGNILGVGDTFNFKSNDKIKGLTYEVVANITDGEFSNTVTWNITIEETDLTLAMILALGIVGFLLFYFAFHLDSNHFLLKIILIFLAIATLVLIPTTMITGFALSSLGLLKITTWLFRSFVIYFSVYLFYHWVKKSEVFQKWLGKIR